MFNFRIFNTEVIEKINSNDLLYTVGEHNMDSYQEDIECAMKWEFAPANFSGFKTVYCKEFIDV